MVTVANKLISNLVCTQFVSFIFVHMQYHLVIDSCLRHCTGVIHRLIFLKKKYIFFFFWGGGGGMFVQIIGGGGAIPTAL